MLIKMLRQAKPQTLNARLEEGAIYDVDEATAKALIDGGDAGEYVTDTAPVADAVEEKEEVTAPIPTRRKKVTDAAD